MPLAIEFPHAHVISTDLSPKSVSLVHTYAQGVTNLTAQVADAQNLQDFPDSTFSLVTCSYGLFFMPEATKALREAYRVLQPGGLYVATVWAWPDKVQMSEVSHSHVCHHTSICLPSWTAVLSYKYPLLLARRNASVPGLPQVMMVADNNRRRLLCVCVEAVTSAEAF